LLAVSLYLSIAGLWPHAVIPYLLHNIEYINAAKFTAQKALSILWLEASSEGALFGAWLLGCAGWLLLTIPLARTGSAAQKTYAAAAVGFLSVSLLSVLTPHQPFLHYAQFLVVPGTLLVGATTGLIVQGLENRPAIWRTATLCGMLVASAGSLVYERMGLRHPCLGQLALFQASPRGVISQELRKFAAPGESVGVWGWMNSCYAETGFRQATRDANSEAEINPSPHRDYFRQRYLADLRASAPPVFVDAVASNGFVFQKPEFRHDRQFPDLAAYIRENYTLASQFGEQRLYVSNQRLISLGLVKESRVKNYFCGANDAVPPPRSTIRTLTTAHENSAGLF